MEVYFRDLGDRIGAEWNCDASAEEFAEIAFRFLSTNSPPERVDTHEILEWALRQPELPSQDNFYTDFGEPPLVVFHGEGFYLEALFWFTSRTAIHGHGFAGAFRVLAGHSIQTEYQFTPQATIGEGVESGELALKNLRLIGPGDVAMIKPGEQFIHCVAHLGRPSITLVARTTKSGGVKQFSYSRSGLAWLPFRRKEDIGRRIALARVFKRRGEFEAFENALIGQVRAGDPHRCFMTMLALVHAGEEEALVERIAEAGCPEPQQLLEGAGEIRRQKRIWGAIGDFQEDKRLSIALGELFGSEAAALEEIGRFFPERPAEETLKSWKSEITL